jgi:hypothetical protein
LFHGRLLIYQSTRYIKYSHNSIFLIEKKLNYTIINYHLLYIYTGRYEFYIYKRVAVCRIH